ncbi:hypothetical protein GW935_00760 [Candidatus Falkowbacteria bacterium]|nr:hypothetical protein [Candidatus Falkowbacteria bacterium]
MPKTNKSTASVVDQAYAEALKVLDRCSDTKTGAFFASGLPGGYEATWSRDSMITSLGAALVGDRYRDNIKKSLEILARNQSYLGQIPNCVGSYNLDRRSDVTFNTVDSSLWFVIGLVAYSWHFKDKAFYAEMKKHLAMSMVWLSYQDPDEVRLIAQQPTMDWMDAFPHKYGYVLNSQALYYGALKMIGKDRQAEHLKRVVNGDIEKYVSLYDPKLGYYYPWAWKNHDDKREHEEWFDTLGNCLAIVMGLATPKIAKSILTHIKNKQIAEPYPCRAIDPPLKPGSAGWHDYFENCDAREPFDYLNGGVWPFIGGFYVAALIKNGQKAQAKIELEKLAKANLKALQEHNEQEIAEAAKKHGLNPNQLLKSRTSGFNEWLDGKKGVPKGEPYQGWSAGAYVFAYHCVQDNAVWYFDYD